MNSKSFHGMEVEWSLSRKPVSYKYAIDFMEKRVEKIKRGQKNELIWILEHPSIYTVGSSGKEEDIINSNNIPVFHTGRGGQVTWHGPGQVIVYVMLNLTKRKNDVRSYVRNLENWIIESLYLLGINADRKKDRIGIWITKKDKTETKIAAIGVRIRHGITYHGISINLDCDLSNYNNIIPCGIKEKKYGVTSILNENNLSTKEDLNLSLQKTFRIIF